MTSQAIFSLICVKQRLRTVFQGSFQPESKRHPFHFPWTGTYSILSWRSMSSWITIACVSARLRTVFFPTWNTRRTMMRLLRPGSTELMENVSTTPLCSFSREFRNMNCVVNESCVALWTRGRKTSATSYSKATPIETVKVTPVLATVAVALTILTESRSPVVLNEHVFIKRLFFLMIVGKTNRSKRFFRLLCPACSNCRNSHRRNSVMDTRTASFSVTISEYFVNFQALSVMARTRFRHREQLSELHQWYIFLHERYS